MQRNQAYAVGVRIMTPHGVGIIRTSRRSRFQPEVRLYEVQLDSESAIRTFSELELDRTNGNPTLPPRVPHLVHHYVPGESVSTCEGEGIIHNLIRDTVSGMPHAIVQLIGTTRNITVPCTDLNPPLEAA